MPNFFVRVNGDIDNRAWVDPADGDKSSRITGTQDQTDRKVKVNGAVLPVTILLLAIEYGETLPKTDAVGGEYETWCLEYASAAEPQQTIPTPGTSALVQVDLEAIGHYTIGMFHKSAGSPTVVVHVDVESTP